MSSACLLGHNSLEAMCSIGGVVDTSQGAVGLDEGVEPAHHVPVPLLLLLLLVPRVRVCHAVLERVLGRRDLLGLQRLAVDQAKQPDK